jgi:capsid protein
MRSGTRPTPELIAQNGRTPEEVIAELKAWNDLLDKNEIILDSDPRKTTMKGLMQKLTGQGGDGSGDGTGDGTGFGN